jgi:hypothetical protein
MRNIWKFVSLVVFCVAGFAVSSVARAAAPANQQKDEQPSELPPSPFEAFAARATATVVWSKLIGRLKGPESRATVTALILEDATATPRVMRGLRIDLAHIGAPPSCDWKYVAWTIMCKRANAAVYVEEGRLEEVRNMLKRDQSAVLRPMEFISHYGTSLPVPGQASTGLIVCGYQFSDRRGSELAALFARAIAELKEASG